MVENKAVSKVNQLINLEWKVGFGIRTYIVSIGCSGVGRIDENTETMQKPIKPRVGRSLCKGNFEPATKRRCCYFGVVRPLFNWLCVYLAVCVRLPAFALECTGKLEKEVWQGEMARRVRCCAGVAILVWKLRLWNVCAICVKLAADNDLRKLTEKLTYLNSFNIRSRIGRTENFKAIRFITHWKIKISITTND
jgi:hypothetical protein